MDLVELNTLKAAIVGLPGISGLSTEQRKRLTIAVELVANPSIIFMDEPTSGLDARAAAIVMRTFGYHLFKSINGVSNIKDSYNPATWMLEVTTVGQEEILGINFAELYKNSDMFRRNKALINELSSPNPGSVDLHFPTQYPQSFLAQCAACLWKQHQSYWRNPEYSAIRIFITTITALLLGTMFWGLGSKMGTSQDLFNSMGSIYSAVLFLGIQNSQIVQPVVDVERTVFYREKAAGMYSALPYAYAQVMVEVPYVILQTIIYCLIVRLLDDQLPVGRFQILLVSLFHVRFVHVFHTIRDDDSGVDAK
ncbi:uncharacterized protein A4U43_C08F6720 [Asparagus officinalis]|nr:uncharacterized protein A4U43_C08F6720 [Asparagus officinalis]